MKKIILFVILLTMGLLVNAQDKYGYYKMPELYGGWLKQLGGDGEWLANSKKWLNYWGIQFAAGSKVRGTLSSSGTWYFASPSTDYNVDKFNLMNQRLESWKDIAIGTDNGIAAKSYFLSDIYNNNTIYGVLGLGRNSDVTLRVLTDKWMRIGSKGGIAIWGNDNAASDDKPHVVVSPDRTLNARYNFSVLTAAEDEGVGGGIHFKRGVSNNPTIRVTKDSWFRIGGKWGIYFWGNDNVEANNNPTLSILGDNVGIGTGPNRPEYKLDVRDGGIRVYKNNIQIMMALNNTQTAGWFGTLSNHPLCLGANNGEAIFIDASQRVYIGLTVATIDKIKADLKNKYDLFVDRGVLSEDYAIAPKSTWSDFVFSKEYTLPSLRHVENFIIENKHLPDVPSATQVAEEGYSQHEMNKTLLQKIEELTLYIIEQQKQINELQLQQGQLK